MADLMRETHSQHNFESDIFTFRYFCDSGERNDRVTLASGRCQCRESHRALRQAFQPMVHDRELHAAAFEQGLGPLEFNPTRGENPTRHVLGACKRSHGHTGLIV